MKTKIAAIVAAASLTLAGLAGGGFIDNWGVYGVAWGSMPMLVAWGS